MQTQTYDTDFYHWTCEQAKLLRDGQFNRIDVEHIAEEIEDMGRAERNQLRNRLTLLLMHLLKWVHQSEYRGASWARTIKEQRRAIPRIIRSNTSLKSALPSLLAEAYQDAREDAADETGLPEQVFPLECPWTYDELTDKDYWPV
ncbi:MAG: hypothetical protein CR991_07285 [Proteobacteria bacterium]|nr:MAG: hypothetical protein CR991_07285 [Pseudomonadota bacterium]